MPENQNNNQILPFFTQSNEPNIEFSYLQSTSYDGYEVFVVASLSSKNIKDKKKFLEIGLDKVQKSFDEVDLPVLDRMKAAIYEGGDYLADQLLENNEPVDDVDFSVGIFAFKDDVVYVWIDGNINARIYRDKDSILINYELTPQFFGSTFVLLGDIFAIASTEDLESIDDKFEDYVLEKATPSYPALYVDYQVENNIDASVIDVKANDEADHNELSSDIDEEPVDNYFPSENKLENNSQEIDSENEKFDNENSIEPIKISERLKTVLKPVMPVFSGINFIVQKLTSPVLDFGYKNIFRKNSHQLKRFQASTQKLQLQYFLVFLICVLCIYFVFVKSGTTTKTSNNTDQTNSTQQVKNEIDSEFSKLTELYNKNQVSEFSTTIKNLRQKITTAKASNNSDKEHLDTILKQAQQYEDTLYKVVPIEKVDGIFMTTNIPNAEIVDFDVVGDDVYAVDKKNGQILKSSATTQEFEVFADAPNLADLSKISCTTGLCYLVDNNKGYAVLNLATKKVVSLPNIVNDGENIKDMQYYLGNLYTLVPSSGKVMKATKSGDTLLAPVQWNIDKGFESDTVDFTIDGNIFELSNKGELRKFLRGKFDSSFSGLAGLPTPLGKDLQITMTPARDANSKLKNRAYISDAENSSILVFDKDSNNGSKYTYIGAYKYRGSDKISFNSFKEMILSSNEKSIYLLEKNSVYRINATEIN